MALLIHDTELLTGGLGLEATVRPPARSTETTRAAAAVYNRCGGLLTRLSKQAGIDIASPIAVWLVQSAGRPFHPLRTTLRFEVQRFYSSWGSRLRQEFDRYFKFGGHNLQTGYAWENHEFRTDPRGTFHSVHHNQNSEYAAFTVARVLAGDGNALNCSCVGGPLLPLDEHELLGYATAMEMFHSYQKSERAQILGFFDYCYAKPAPKAGDLLRHLREREWYLFAKYYVEPDRTPLLPERLEAAHTLVEKMTGERK